MSEMNETSVAYELSYCRILSVTFFELYEYIFDRVKDYTKEAVEHLILASIIYIVLCILLYAGIARWEVITFQKGVKNPRRVLIIISHPDDECMFFGPTVLNFTRNNNCLVYLMCLSIGTNYGMGKTRKNELYKSCKVLGIDESSIFIHSHTLLPDCQKTKWPVELLAQLILKKVETFNIDTLITFDKHGVSSHINHCSIYYAIAYLCIEKHLPTDCKVYVLESVSIIRKYWLILDIPLSYLLSRNRFILNANDRDIVKSAMKEHKSQLVWFRRLYLIFSRYTMINTLQEMDITDIELDLELED